MLTQAFSLAPLTLQKKTPRMALDPYASCPCGSGKKFKWCCQPIHAEIDRAFRQDAEGQHEVALRLMDEVIKAHPDNPEGYGRKAQLLYQNDRAEDAEATLLKAFEVSPKYPFGHLLRGLFRYHEGEVPGALLLFRKAAEYYDPEARDLVGQAYGMIADCELKMNRPVAARAAFRIALACQPSDVEMRESFEAVFGDKGRLPWSARREYAFRPPAPSAGGERRAAWDRALSVAGQARLSDAARAFDELTKADPEDGAAWHNLGLARAWLGDNAGALEALDAYVQREPDEAKAGEAWALGEVLRLGQGMEEQSDHREYAVVYEIRDPRPVSAVLEEWQRAQRLVAVEAGQQQDVFGAILLDVGPVFSAAPAQAETAPLAGYLMVAPGMVRVSGPLQEPLDRVRAELEQKAGPGLVVRDSRVLRGNFGDVVTEAVVLPSRPAAREDLEPRVRARAEQFFEGTWLQRPLRSLNGIPPIDAAGHGVLRKKLRGVVQFLEDCAAGTSLQVYDFGRLRRKLGLLDGGAAPAGAAADVTGLGAPELAALKAEDLSDEQLEQALQTAQRLDAHEVGGHFARALTARPARADRPDRYPWYSYLVQRAVAEGRTDEALDLINEGEKADCEQNEGRRRNDYELRRGQVHAKRGEADAAQDVFDRLVQRDPSNLRTRGLAAEAMLSLRQAARALRFAEEGLAEARKRQDRDSEGYLMELAAAARKQGA
jgi:tetratricopeptide (TPR) repeat protein